jgi:alpha-galactosidase
MEKITDSKAGAGTAITLLSGDKQAEVTLNYLLYPGLPLIRKSLVVKNLTNQTLSLESVDVKKLSVTKYYPNTYSWVYSNYGRRRSLGAHESNRQDALVIVHNPEWKQGMIISNEAACVMKRTAVFCEDPEISSGLTHKNALFAFR